MKRALLCVFLGATSAHAAGDYAATSTEWNGLAQLGALATERGCRLEPTERLDWSSLGARDTVWFVYPRATVDPRRLERWLRAGGRALLADDFGAADAALRSLGIRRVRRAADGPAPDVYQQNLALPIARPLLLTELGRAATQIVANHPAGFQTAIPATFAFKDGTALVVEGQLGHGAFVALADPSVLINNMLELEENHAFARALLAASCGPNGRVVLVSHAFTEAGEPPDELLPTGPSVFSAFNEKMSDVSRRLNGSDTSALTFAALLFALAAVALFVGGFPGPARLTSEWTRAPRTEEGPGYPLAIWPGDFSPGAAIVREELLERLEGVLGAVPLDRMMPQELGARVRARHGAEAGRRATELWRLLHRFRWHKIDGAILPEEHVSRAAFLRLHRAATALHVALAERAGVDAV